MRIVSGMLVVLGVLVLAPTLALGQRSPEAVTRALQQRYESVRDFTADFSHSYRGGVLRTQAIERGTVAVKKPGRMRWVYTSPERKEFVSDGQKVYSYLPEDRQVIVSDVPPGNEASTPALFLAGKGDLVRDFTSAFAETTIPGSLALKLTPKSSEPDYEYLVVVLDADTLQIRALTTRDHQGGDSTLTFSRMRENQGLPDSQFQFRIPRGTDVITNGTT
ncbi:MAG: outer membrane lipoprotein carrier protein LolA [Acidobacteria bacterium]|nr:outer membrane lipoprotein carrier protein LolA [Acidobacteriota bacterium]